MRLSIALCTYNGGRFLGDQFASFAAQTRLPDEVVVCDDGSTDGTVSIIESFAQSVPFPISLYRNPNRLRYCANFEKAASLCQGDIISFSNQDDVWYPSKLKRTEETFARFPDADALFCDADVVDEHRRPMGRTAWQGYRFNRRLQNMMLHGRSAEVMLRTHPAPLGMCIAFRAHCLKWLRPFPSEGVGHDRWAVLLTAFVSDVMIIQEVLAQYRQHPRNISGGIKVGPLTDRLKSVVVQGPAMTRQKRYLDRVKIFAALRNRLTQLDQVPDMERKLDMVDRKIRHLERRANMPSVRICRVPHILRECINLGYQRCSEGFVDVLRDLAEKDQRC